MVKDARIGEIIGGHYELVSIAGRGGQSIVYRARALKGGADVAVKVLKEGLMDDPNARERMSREANALMNLAACPAALKIFGQYWTKDGCLCMVTEFLKGVDLDDYLHEHEELMPLPMILRLFPDLISTLEVAHSQGVVHRDIKPGNIFLVDEPAGIRLLDFGFAKFIRLRSFTETGSVAGSPRYIPPEGWKGMRDLDGRVDVYSMGVLLYRCLSGRTPFEAETLPELLELVTTAQRPSLHALRPDLPAEIDQWVEQVLAIERSNRFQNIRAMWTAFDVCIHRRF